MAINWNTRAYTREELTEATKKAHSYAEVARLLGMNDSATPYKSIKPAIADLDLDTSHFRGRGWNIGLGFRPIKNTPLESLLVVGSHIGSTRLKERLIKEGILEPKCSAPYCPVPNPSIHPFTGEPVELKLALDHINGDNSDNRLENLRLLCYHCHGLTETWCRGGGTSKAPKKTYQCVECFEPIERHKYLHKACRRCIQCGEMSNGRKNYCLSCGGKSKRTREPKPHSTKIDWPPRQEILDRLAQSNYTRLGKELGVSDNAIRKFLERTQL